MYCPYLWKHQCITTKGWTKPCCHADTTDEWKKVDFAEGLHANSFVTARNRLESGIFPECCKTCKDNENQSLESQRLRAIIKDPEVITSPELTSLDIKFNNKCNLGCIMCSPNDSSILEDLYKHSDNLPIFAEKDAYFPNKPIDYMEDKKEEYIKTIAANGLKELKITGGEPFASIHFVRIIEWLIDNDFAKNITLQFNTNGTKYNRSIIEKLHHFKKLKIIISVDGTGDTYNYIRKGSEWNKTLQNLKLFSSFKKDNLSFFKDSGSYIAISCVLQFCNITNIQSLVQTCIDLDLPFYIDINLRPENNELDAKYAPTHLKDILLSHCDLLFNKLKQEDQIAEIKKVKKYLQINYNAYSIGKKKDLKETMRRIDMIHNTEFKNFLDKPLIEWLQS